ncbi:MAG TPA: DUF3618 domain-containing protein [Marmoricola sp.]|nr:DUF3618 domain-containing protein [Marmoricola sp.]
MTTPSDHPDPATSTNGTRSKEEIEADIARTRQQLGETVDALSQKLDVKSRLKERAKQGREQAAEAPVVPIAVVAGVVLLATLLVRRRRKKG